MKFGEWTLMGSVFGGSVVAMVGLLLAVLGYWMFATVLLLPLGLLLLVIGIICAAFGLWTIGMALIAHFSTPGGRSVE